MDAAREHNKAETSQGIADAAGDEAVVNNVVSLERQRNEVPAPQAAPEAKTTPEAKKAEQAPAPTTQTPIAPAAPAKKRSKARIVFPVLIAAALGAGGWYGYNWWTNGRFMI